MSSVLNLDFGSSFTKVGLRLKPDGLSTIVSAPSETMDEADICIPTLVLLDQSASSPNWRFGVRVVDQAEGQGITIYRNWKPRLFSLEDPEPPSSRPQPESKIDAFLDELGLLGQRQLLIRELATLHGLQESQVMAVAEARGLTLAELRQCVRRLQPIRSESAESNPAFPSERFLAARTSISEGRKLPGSTDLEFREVTVRYFQWLRTAISGYCRKHGILDLGKVPVRICVPAFEPILPEKECTSSEELLLEMLREAGWTTHDHSLTISEPFANAIGILTGGRNQTWVPNKRRPSERSIHLGEMFGSGPLVNVLAKRKGSPEKHVVLVIDVGAYTSDFALLEFGPFEGMVPPVIRSCSEPLGVDELDRRVQALLPPSQQEAFAKLSFRKREDFHDLVYTQQLRYGLAARQYVEGKLLDKIQGCIRELASQIADRLDHFLVAKAAQVHELILTGGGNVIPGIHQTLYQRLLSRGLRVVHMPSKEKSVKDSFHPLGPQLVRGGSALGGTSIYIDYEVH
jgi:hypothetical protein